MKDDEAMFPLSKGGAVRWRMRIVAWAPLAVAILLMSSCNNNLYSITTVSPRNTYKVYLREEKGTANDKDRWPYKVFLNVTRHGEQMINGDLVSVSDGWELRFGDKYPAQHWVAEDILRLGGAEIIPQAKCDVLNVRNDTATPIAYLIISSRNGKPSEKFLVLDLQPQSTITLYAQPQTDQGADMSWIMCQTKFADGREIPAVGMNFAIAGLYKGPAHYCLIVEDGKVVIKSKEFEGVEFSSGNRVTIPKAVDCSGN